MPICKMPDPSRGYQTTPLIAVSVATGSFDVLRVLYSRVVVPHEVQQEILAGGRHAPCVADFLTSEWLDHQLNLLGIAQAIEAANDH